MVEASIDDMQTAMRRGRVTSKELVLQSFARIAFYNARKGVGFTGLACSEPTLIEMAYAFEQATKKRIPPPSTP